jgi:hypothetical protein
MAQSNVPRTVRFKTTVRQIEVDVTIDCQRVAEIVGMRLARIKRGKATAVEGAVVVRRVQKSDRS